jgi:hypothetical protein
MLTPQMGSRLLYSKHLNLVIQRLFKFCLNTVLTPISLQGGGLLSKQLVNNYRRVLDPTRRKTLRTGHELYRYYLIMVPMSIFAREEYKPVLTSVSESGVMEALQYARRL